MEVSKEKEHKSKVRGIIDFFKGVFSKIKNLSLRNKIILGAIALALVIALVLSLVFLPGGGGKTIRTAKVSRGNISVVISGTGTIEPIDEYEVTSLVKGEILLDTFQEGDMVEEGDLLYQIDAGDMENSLEKAQLNMQKSQLSYNQTMDDLAKLNVKSTYSGTITEMYVKVGDSVGSGTKIADIVDMETMVLEVPFNEIDAEAIYTGATAQVMLTGSFYNLTGTVRRVSNSSLISGEGARVKQVEITVQNPGAIKPGDMATVTIGNVACNGPGTFSYNLATSIKAEASGDVISLPVGKGDKISAGGTVAVLHSSTADRTRQNSQISLRDAQLSIDNYNKQLENYQITAPISGTVLKKTSKAGDTLDNSNASVVMAVIADMSTIVFEMNVDELDISKVKVGQTVSVTADALEDRRYSGYVDYVSVVGTTQNGVTTYPIQVVVEEPEGLIPGMNVSAEIVVESREDVLRVPVTAVQRGNVVYVKGNGKTEKTAAPAGTTGAPDEVKQFGDRMKPAEGISGEMPQGERPGEIAQGEKMPAEASGNASEVQEQTKAPDMVQGEQPLGEIPEAVQKNAPDGFRAVRVVTGINDSDYIEILSGLSEGDEVYVPITASSGVNAMFGMMGMGGGMPSGGMSGGMPSGGMSGGMGGMSGGRTR